jgi:diguanylate cyclase (GGDEF)-like protein/PAS domain S-box-containing protein
MAITEKLHLPSIMDERALPDPAHACLRLLAAVLNLTPEHDSCSELFEALHYAFGVDQALLLEDDGEDLACTAAAPNHPLGRCWPPGPFLRSILDGRVFASASDAQDGAEVPEDLIAHTQPAICMPIALQGRHAILVLLRTEGRENFTVAHVAAARQCAVVALATLIAGQGDKLETEIERLTALAEELRANAQRAQQESGLIKAIIDHLPIGLTVQDDQGRFVLVNAVAAGNLAMPAEALIGASPNDFLSPEDAASRREWELGLIQSGTGSTAEEEVAGPAGGQTWLTSHKPIRILEQTLLLTSSHDITGRKEIEYELAQRANFDELTGLPNRVLVEHRVDEVIRRGDQSTRFALAFIDLDNFKHINDYYSHAVGDALLIKIAERIAVHLRGSDTLARISGDEFLLHLSPMASEDEIHTTIERILCDLKQPFHIESYEVFTSASIGVTIYPEHGASYEALRRNADNAMYRAKNATKGGAIYFDVNMGHTISARMELEQRLRLAIRDRRFCCAFQPKVDIRSQEVVGFETLVRWRDDDGEIHPPSSFIGLAIELGLIDPITHFVLAEALKSIERLDEAFGRDTTISVNVAAKQANDLQFMRSFARALRDSECPERIMIELTEEAFVAKSQFQMEVLPLLREMGVRVSIDDFGTGYSSLGVLADITADEIKVDRSFITSIHERPRSQSVLRTIDSLGYSLDMTIVAEGVETFEELAYLQAATQIRYAQGYYFSKPFFLEDAAAVRRASFEARMEEAAREPSDRRGLRFARDSSESRLR